MQALLENPDTLLLMSAMLCLLIGSGFFSASETALFFLSTEEIQAFQRNDRPSERIVVALLKQPDRLLTAVLFWNLLINLTFFAVGVVISGKLMSTGNNTAAGVFGLLNLSLMIVFGEVVPKSSAVMFRQPLARLVSFPLAFAVQIFDPLAPTFGSVTRTLRRVFWPEIKREQYLHPEDLEQAIENSAGNKSVLLQERQVLHNILNLSEIQAEEVMRPRGTYRAIAAPVHLSDLANTPIPADYLVILAEEGDDVVGAVPLASFTVLARQNLEDAAEDVIHVPWCAPVAQVLQRLEDASLSLASVINEYGETIGVVTYEDIVDSIVSAEPSRARRVLQRDPVLVVGPDSWHVDGMTSLRYLSRRLNIGFEPEVDGQVTVAGIFHEQLQRMPELDDKCHWQSYELTIVEMTSRQHFLVLVTPQSPADGKGS
ncbi:MAG: CNNM domain-containing protein [Planctomycetales bacterium]|jgi:putative hemolysin